MDKKGWLLIAILAVIMTTGVNSVCVVETVCQLVHNGELVGQFDCSTIYSRLGNYWNESSKYVKGSLANIQMIACSDLVVNILKNKFNITGETVGCDYYCCVTDGTCYSREHYAVNIQQMMLVTEER